MTSTTYSTDVSNYEKIQYNNNLNIIRSKNDDMFQCQSIMSCLGYNEKRYKNINQYFDLKGTKELINEITKNSGLRKITDTHEIRENIDSEQNFYLLNFKEVNETRNNLPKELRGT
jgi:ABC-type tungstate transport system permease subunit